MSSALPHRALDHGRQDPHRPMLLPLCLPHRFAASSAPATSTSATTGAAAPVHPAHAVASSANPTASVRIAGPAAPVARALAVASGTGRTTTTRPVSIHPVENAHPMRTRGKAGITQPMDRVILHIVPMSPLPRSVRDTLSDPNWCSAMQAEYDVLLAMAKLEQFRGWCAFYVNVKI